MSNYSLRQKLRYKFDNFMSRGGRSIFLGLVTFFILALIVCAILRIGIDSAPYEMVGDTEREKAHTGGDTPADSLGVTHHVFMTFLFLSDPGTMAYDIDSSPWYKVSAVFAGMFGVVIFSALIAFITTALDQKIRELKKGHSRVIEEDHTLILGWNERVVEILRELMLANESEDDPCVVILSKKDKEEIDDFLNLHLKDRKNTRVVTRSGAESSLVNLEIASVASSKSVIVLASCNPAASAEEKSNSDNIVIKTILAVVASLPEDSEAPIVAEIFLERNRQVVEEISPNIVTVDTNDILSKILVQTSRSVGLSVVYAEMLSFDGCEMYFHQDKWGDISFGDLAFHFPDGIPMGILREDGELLINPPIDRAMEKTDSILILAEDDSTIHYKKKPVAKGRDLKPTGEQQQKDVKERELIIGWTEKVETIIREYADYVSEGSQIDVMLRLNGDEKNGDSREHIIDEIERVNADLPSVSVSLIDQDPLTTQGLIAAEPFQYDNIIILSQGKVDEDERTDSETIVILLLLRNIFKKHPDNGKNTKLITEVLDSENQDLVARAGVHDFLISNRVISMLLAQISENAEIKRVYDDLFSEDGSEIYLKPATLYFEEFPVEVTYADMIRVAQAREEVCLGVKLKSLERALDQNFGVKLIPDKNATYTLTPEDTLVVLSEDES